MGDQSLCHWTMFPQVFPFDREELSSELLITTACRYLTCNPNFIYANTRKTRTGQRFETAKQRAFSGAVTAVIAFPFTGGPSHSTKSNTTNGKRVTSRILSVKPLTHPQLF